MPQRFLAFEFVVRSASQILGTGGAGLGAAMVWAGPDRFSAVSFATARLIPGAQTTWGCTLLAAGLLAAIGSFGRSWPGPTSAGLALEAVWFLFFAVALAQATFTQPTAAVTGPFAYGMLAALCMFVAVALRWTVTHRTPT